MSPPDRQDKSSAASASAPSTRAPSLLPLGALAAGFGLLTTPAFAQSVTAPVETAAASQAPGSPADTVTLPRVMITRKAETDRNSVRATTSTIGRGNQDLRDIPQSVTVVTEKLLEDRHADTVKQALHYTAGISFQAAEGGEEDIRLRGFSLAASGDIYVDSVRDPAFYERDVFSFDRLELLRGSASMLFGRGSTGGVVNQVSKQPVLADVSEVGFTAGNGNYMRFTGDFNIKASETSALRVNAMGTQAANWGNRLDKYGIAPSFRWNIGSPDEFTVAGYYLRNDNGINYGVPWLRKNAANPAVSGLIESIDPKSTYAAPSDYNAGGAAWVTGGHTHRFSDVSQLKTTIRQGHYDRDQRASAIRFYTNTNPANGPIVLAPGADTINESTPLTRGTNNKVQDMNTTYAQTEYTNELSGYGMMHALLGGVDLAHEVFHNNAAVLPTGVTLDKNTPRTTIGTPDNDLGAVDEGARILRRANQFDAKALGLYGQDLLQVAPDWKLLGGLRYDRFKGDYHVYSTAVSTQFPVIGTETAPARDRTDNLWSKRAGVLYQPTDAMSFHFSYGTSFNTSGDTYQYDDQTKNTPPESSENLELGGKLEGFDGRLSTRFAIFKSIKKNERNRDPDSAATEALLSGKRHTAGVEFDVAGRITRAWEIFASYAWTPIARIDVGAPNSVAGIGEGEGTRSALTPRHSGSLFTTYQINPAFRFGGGLNARSSETPNRNPVGIVAPQFVTGDLLAEYTYSEQVGFKFNVLNVTNKLYADSLYTAHYIPGQPRTIFASVAVRF